jgi:hypothetical protein
MVLIETEMLTPLDEIFCSPLEVSVTLLQTLFHCCFHISFDLADVAAVLETDEAICGRPHI